MLDGETDPVKTQIDAFFTPDGEEIARTHCYVRRDGTLAASGLLDPKQVMCNGVLYFKL
jgi:hypothetical protein